VQLSCQSFDLGLTYEASWLPLLPFRRYGSVVTVRARKTTEAARAGDSSRFPRERRRDAGFWVKDFQAEVWLYLLAQQARAMADAPHGSRLLRAIGVCRPRLDSWGAFHRAWMSISKPIPVV
jgi:hypothetical protein